MPVSRRVSHSVWRRGPGSSAAGTTRCRPSWSRPNVRRCDTIPTGTTPPAPERATSRGCAGGSTSFRYPLGNRLPVGHLGAQDRRAPRDASGLDHEACAQIAGRHAVEAVAHRSSPPGRSGWPMGRRPWPGSTRTGHHLCASRRRLARLARFLSNQPCPSRRTPPHGHRSTISPTARPDVCAQHVWKYGGAGASNQDTPPRCVTTHRFSLIYSLPRGP